MTSQLEQDGSGNMPEGDIQAIQYLKKAIFDGVHWYMALLEAIKLWTTAEETYNDRFFRYLIDNEAFDWLLLAERLCEEISDQIPEEEMINLLFFDRPPMELSHEEFQKNIGQAKYRAYLNYLYGILVEDALILAVLNDIRKEQRSFSSSPDADNIDRAYNRIYGGSQQVLLNKFRKEKNYPHQKITTLNELKEFTYWLFKHRIKTCDKSLVASDTRKALIHLQHRMPLK